MTPPYTRRGTPSRVIRSRSPSAATWRRRCHGETIRGFAFPKLLFYFLVGVAFGTLALLNDSILPVIPVHVAGDLIFFVFIWPHDPARQHVSIAAADGWFWAHVAQIAACGSLAVWTFRQIPRMHHPMALSGE